MGARRYLCGGCEGLQIAGIAGTVAIALGLGKYTGIAVWLFGKKEKPHSDEDDLVLLEPSEKSGSKLRLRNRHNNRRQK